MADTFLTGTYGLLAPRSGDLKTAKIRNEGRTAYSLGSSSILSSPHLLLCKSWGVVVVVGSCGGIDSGTSASPPSYPVFLLSLNVLNEWCMKSLRPLLLLLPPLLLLLLL